MENKLGDVTGFTKMKIASEINLSPKRVFGEANALASVNFVRKNSEELEAKREIWTHRFDLNAGNSFVKHLAKYLNIQLHPEHVKI